MISNSVSQWQKLAMVFSSCLLTTHSALADENRATEPTQFKSHVSPFLQTHCAACHDEDLSEADLAVHDLGSAAELRRWEKILEMLSLELMPPSDEEQPSGREARRVIGWIHAELAKLGREPDLSRLETPRFGNRVPHEDLFSGKHVGPAFSPSRLWRMSPDIYAQMATDKGIRRNLQSGLADARPTPWRHLMQGDFRTLLY